MVFPLQYITSVNTRSTKKQKQNRTLHRKIGAQHSLMAVLHFDFGCVQTPVPYFGVRRLKFTKIRHHITPRFPIGHILARAGDGSPNLFEI